MTLEGYAGRRGDGGFGKHGDICGGCQWVGLVRSVRGRGGFVRWMCGDTDSGVCDRGHSSSGSVGGADGWLL